MAGLNLAAEPMAAVPGVAAGAAAPKVTAPMAAPMAATTTVTAPMVTAPMESNTNSVVKDSDANESLDPSLGQEVNLVGDSGGDWSLGGKRGGGGHDLDMNTAVRRSSAVQYSIFMVERPGHALSAGIVSATSLFSDQGENYGCEILVQMSCIHWLRRLGGCVTRRGCVNQSIWWRVVSVLLTWVTTWMTLALARRRSIVGVDRDVIEVLAVNRVTSRPSGKLW